MKKRIITILIILAIFIGSGLVVFSSQAISWLGIAGLALQTVSSGTDIGNYINNGQISKQGLNQQWLENEGKSDTYIRIDIESNGYYEIFKCTKVNWGRDEKEKLEYGMLGIDGIGTIYFKPMSGPNDSRPYRLTYSCNENYVYDDVLELRDNRGNYIKLID